ncbi:MAG: hypothetical protein Q9207_007893, partial [Kuettlingeria erythrocarpa]
MIQHTLETVHCPFIQQQQRQGLGTLNKLPPEVRAMTWEYLLPSTTAIPTTPNRTLRCRTISASPHIRSRNNNTLALLRTSRLLYFELTTHLYRNRTLPLCFNQLSHDHNPQRAPHGPLLFIPTLCGGGSRGTCCRQVDAAGVPFARFAALDIRVRFCRYRVLEHLVGWIGGVVGVVGEQRRGTRRLCDAAPPPFPPNPKSLKPKLKITIADCTGGGSSTPGGNTRV